jgi:3'(2'), 5'-bisphosphate nucleotidase
MKNHDLSLELNAALAAVASAARATLAVRCQGQERGVGTLQKEDKSPVTVADFAAQALVARSLSMALPCDPLLGEEDGASLREPAQAQLLERIVAAVAAALGEPCSAEDVLGWLDRGNAKADTGRYWVLDPVDGTKGFLRGGQYAVALALVADGEVQTAALGCPAYGPGGEVGEGLILAAQKGCGAFEVSCADPMGPRTRITVAKGRSLAESRLCESVESGHTDQSASQQIAAALQLGGQAVRMDSQAKYAAVARGDADLYLRLPTRKDYQEKVWDHAAGALVLAEAGGVVTDCEGRPLDFGCGPTLARNRGVVASNGSDHAAVVAAVRQALGG